MSEQLVVGDVFRNAARAVPDRVAAVLGDTALTFGVVDRRANATAARLHALGMTPGDRLVAWSATALDLVVVFAAAAKAGIVFAPVNPALGIDEARTTIAAARPVAIVADALRRDAADQVGAALGVRVLALADLVGDESDVDPAVPVRETAPHVVFFTSGSTGRPKGAVLSHRVNVLRTHPGSQFEPRGANVCMFPLFHMAGWTIALGQWQARDAVVLLEQADPVAIAAAVARHRATRLNCIPLVWKRILDEVAAGRIAPDAFATLRFADTGTSATPVELLRAIRALVPQATVRVFYGSTEAGNVAMLYEDHFESKPGRVGVPSLLTRARLTGAGELEVSGPLVFDGYFDDPEATAAALVDGWYRTGDLAELDADGYVTIVGRARTVIRSGGESVAPSEVEAVLATHPGVAEVAVVGVPDADYGELVTAVVVPEPGIPIPTLADLREYAADRLAGFKLPRRLETVEALPRTAATGQVQRHLLVARLTA